MPGLWKKKSLDLLRAEAAESEHGLRRTLGPLALMSLGIGAIVGAGIFVLSGVAAQHTGPALVLSVVLTGVGCAFAGLCYAEFAAMIPVAGSAYTYSYATIGEFLAWIIGWDLILEYAVGATTVSIGWSGYFVSFLQRTLHLPFPAELSRSPWEPIHLADGTTVHAFFNLPAAFIILLITTLLIIGIRESANFNNFIVLVKVGVVILFIIVGALYVHRANWHPFFPPNQGVFGEFGFSGVLRGAGIIFFAYIGFDAVSTAAQEARNPERDMPIGILGSLAVCTVLYILAVMVLTGLEPYRHLNVADPLAIAIDSTPARAWLSPIVKLGAPARNYGGYPGNDAGTNAGVLFHGARWPSPQGFWPHSPALPHPLHQHRPDRCLRGHCRWPAPPADCGGTGEHRNLAGVRDCQRLRDGDAQAPPGNSPPLSHPLGVAGGSPRYRYLRGTNVGLAARHLDSFVRVDGHRSRYLLQL